MTLPSPPTDRALPRIALTCGDPAGIGPEIVCLAWANPAAHAGRSLRVVADPEMLARALEHRVGMPRLTIEATAWSDRRPSDAATMLVVDPGPAGRRDAVPLGEISAAGGLAAVRALEAAFSATRAGHADAIVTGPLHKEAIHAAGFDVPGHTEWLARACGLPDTAASSMSEANMAGRLKSSTSIPSTRPVSTAGQFRQSWMKSPERICMRAS